MTVAEMIERHYLHEGALLPCADGGYPVVYIGKGNTALCPDCATREIEVLNDYDEPTGALDLTRIVAVEIHHEGPPIDCDGCTLSIKSAYGDPEGCATCQELTTESCAYSYRQADDDDQPLYKDARDGDPVCWEHARHCRFCRKCFAPCQFENHIISQECEGLSRLSRFDLLCLVFPEGTEVLVPRHDGQGQDTGVVLGILANWETITVRATIDTGATMTDHYANWSVKRADIHAV